MDTLSAPTCQSLSDTCSCTKLPTLWIDLLGDRVLSQLIPQQPVRS